MNTSPVVNSHLEVERLCQSGVNFRAQKKLLQAVECYLQALAIDPRHLGARNCLGNALRDLGRLEEAEQIFLQAIEIDPAQPIILCNLGHALFEQGRFYDASIFFQRALKITPDFYDAIFYLGASLEKQGQYSHALACYLRALQVKPGSLPCMKRVALMYTELDQPRLAIPYYRKVLALDPRLEGMWNNLGIAYEACNKSGAAILCYKAAISLRPENEQARYHLSMAYLAKGDYKQGFLEYEYRWNSNPESRKTPRSSTPPWLGQPELGGKKILLHAEQGLGDTFFLARFIPLVISQGARVILEVQPQLKSFFSHQFPVEHIYSAGETPPPVDYHCPLFSLPLAFSTSSLNIPNAIPYLYARKDLIQEVATQLNAKNGMREHFRVGVCWQGAAEYKLDKLRSPGLVPFCPLFQVQGVHFFTLQKDDRAKFLSLAGVGGVDLGHDLDTDTAPFEETAALMMNLDLIITSDTSIAHLACALGRPCWIVLPYAAEWRWLRHREDSPWYPSARLFRQAKPGDWKGVFTRVASALHEKLTPMSAE